MILSLAYDIPAYLVEQARRHGSHSAHEQLLARGGLYAGLYQTQFRHAAEAVAESYPVQGQ